ncbi:MAG: hypothetical protein NT038_03625 [Euryarchaeota archaeon]|nr:hypothetical protein [Euryarchaeota archaeon]
MRNEKRHKREMLGDTDGKSKVIQMGISQVTQMGNISRRTQIQRRQF